MGFSIAQYADLRPTLWHLTHRNNLDSIRTSRLLISGVPAKLNGSHRCSTTPPGSHACKALILSNRIYVYAFLAFQIHMFLELQLCNRR